MKVCTVIGARPQFIKAAAVSAKFAEDDNFDEVLIHTGQHYDDGMSEVFFRELGIPREKYNLETGSGLHGLQTGRMLEKIESVLLDESPEFVLIYGDTNSTLAGALAAVKLHIPVAHVEAGMRSFNRRMPEEINRVVSDHVCALNFCSTETAVANLKHEGRGHTAMLVGDVMYDAALRFSKIAEKTCDPFAKFAVSPGNYILLTCHRAENTDNPERLAGIIAAVNLLAESCPVIYPIHPRTRKYLEDYQLRLSDAVITIPPAGYLDMLLLERHAKLILTDSGGIQKEAFFLSVPCVTMRDETEWVETVDVGWNITAGAETAEILAAVAKFADSPPEKSQLKPYGDGDASGKILAGLQRFSGR